MSDFYILDDNGEPIRCGDVITWGRWFETNSKKRVIARTNVTPKVMVSTVFLGLDHGWGAKPPVLWETMIFGGANDEYCARYSSRADAIEGHKKAVKMAKGEFN